MATISNKSIMQKVEQLNLYTVVSKQKLGVCEAVSTAVDMKEIIRTK